MKYGTFKYGTETYGGGDSYYLSFSEGINTSESFARTTAILRSFKETISLISSISLKLNGLVITNWTKRTPISTTWEKRND